MTDLQSTLDAIDAATAPVCGWCSTPLGPESPSDLFCGPDHQDLYMERQGEALVGYVEPDDIPAHVYNLVEESGPETTPRGSPRSQIAEALRVASLPFGGHAHIQLYTTLRTAQQARAPRRIDPRRSRNG